MSRLLEESWMFYKREITVLYAYTYVTLQVEI